MAVIYLIRHGQASFHEEDYDNLSELGITQAKVLGPCISSKIGSPKIAIQGTMNRHIQTAQYVLSSLTSNDADTTLICNQAWNEFDHREILTAYHPELSTPATTRNYFHKNKLPKEHFQQLLVAAIERWIGNKHSSEYTESWGDFTHRVLHAFKQLSINYPDQDLVVFTSGGPISLISCHLLGIPLEQLMRVNLALVNCGITKIFIHPTHGRPILSTLNEHSVFEVDGQGKLLTYT